MSATICVVKNVLECRSHIHRKILKKLWYGITTLLNLVYISVLTLALILEEWKVGNVLLLFLSWTHEGSKNENLSV